MNYTEIVACMAESMRNIAEQVGRKLPFNKTYPGKITGKENHLYTVFIHGTSYKISSEFDFDIHTDVNVTAIQNNFNRLYLEPNLSAMKNSGKTVSASGNGVQSVNGQSGFVTLDKSHIGLSHVDNSRQYSAQNPPPYPVNSVNGQTGEVLIASPITIDMTDSSQASNPLAVIKANWPHMPDGCYTAVIRCGSFYGATIQRLNQGDYGSVQIIGYTLPSPLYYRCSQGVWS